MTYYSNIVHFDPEGHKTHFSNTVSFETASIPAITASADIVANATVTAEAQKLKGASFDTVTGSASVSCDYQRVRGVSADVAGEAIAQINNPIKIAIINPSVTGLGIVEAKALRLSIFQGDYEITADNYRKKNQPANSSEIANHIIVETQPLQPSNQKEVYRKELTLAAGEEITITAKFNEEPVIDHVVQLYNSNNIAINSTEFYAWGADITLQNSGDNSDTFQIAVEGKVLTVQGAERINEVDVQSITENGEIEYTFPDNHLIQTKAIAEKIADKLLESFKNPRRDLKLDWRGNPALELSDIIATMEYDTIGRFYAVKQELTYDGALTADLEGRKKE